MLYRRDRLLYGLALTICCGICLECTASDPPPTAQDYLAFVTPYFPGVWNHETITNQGEVAAKGVITMRLAPGGKCFVSHGKTEDGQPLSTALHGYDPQAGHWKVIEYGVDGSVVTLDVHGDKQTLAQGAKAGATYKYQMTKIAADGTSTSSTWTAHIVNRNILEMRFVKGDNADDLKMIRYKRHQ